MTSRIGKYEVHSEIGRGGFGRVFRAYDPVTRRSVAIKVLITENDPDVLARFFLEVQATAALKHKNIVTIYDFNETPPYIVMEFVEGESLQQVISHHASLSLLEKVRILSQAAEGLACAHKHGIVHRDIKPANIMVLPSCDVKIMDFGIARVSGQTEARRTRQGDVIGTILYISPERIRGVEADACSDIFSFGVVGCELITGKHPFAGEHIAAVAYKIAQEEVPPLYRLVPECPEALDVVIQRAIAKEPGDRYQNMDEILFDLKPVLLELAQRQAASIMQEVLGMIDSGQLVEAQDRVRSVLELDPTNWEARRVHDSLQKDQRRRQVRTKVETLLREGGVQLEQRQFNKAIQSFESAWRLDTSDTHINELLEHAKTALEANRQAGRLLSDARRELLAGNLDAANEIAAGALKTDPQHQDAAEFYEKLRQQIEERDKRLRVEREIQRAEELLALEDFNGARAVLANIEPEADPDVIANVRWRIETGQAERVRSVRETRVQVGVATARQQMKANQLAEAEETLRALLDEFPDATSAAKLLDAIREHIEAQRRAEAISNLTQRSQNLMQSKNFLEARRVLEAGLQTYPADAALQRLLGRALDLQREHERAQATAQVLDQACKLQSSGGFEDALALVRKALAELGHDVALAELKRQLEFDREEQLYHAGLRKVLATGQELFDAGRFADAVAILEASAAQYPGEPEFASLLTSARHVRAEQEERQLVAGAVARVGELGTQQKWQDALERAEEALKRYPYNATLSELTSRARENWRQQQQQYDVARRRGDIEQALVSGSVTRAANELKTARQDFPGEHCFDELEERLRQAQVQSQLDLLEQQVHRSMAQGDLEGAVQQLNASKGLADHPRWQALQTELVQRQAYQHSLHRARRLHELRDYQAAAELLQQVIGNNPPDSEAAALLQAIRTEHRRLEGERTYRQALEEAERLRAGGEYHKAQEILQEAVRGAIDQRAAELLRTVTTERGQIERRQHLEQGKREVRELIDRGDFSKALPAIDKLWGDFSADSELAKFRVAAEQQRDTFEAIAKTRDLEHRSQFDAALDIAESALLANPENPDLVKTVGRLRQAAVEQLVGAVRSCFEKNDLTRAQVALDRAKKRWETDPHWQALRKDLEQRQAHEAVSREAELARKHAEQSIRDGRQQAVSLAAKGDLQGALEIFEGLCRKYPDHAGVEQDRQAALRKIEVGFVNRTLTRITALREQQKWDAALQEAELAVKRYPRNSELADVAVEERRRKEIALCIQEIDRAIASHDWSTAEKRLQAAQARFAGERAFERLVQALLDGRRQEELKNFRSLVERYLFEGQLEDATREIEVRKSGFSNEAVWQDVKRQLELHQAYTKALLDAEQLRREARHENAEEILRQAIARGAPDTRAAQLLQVVTAQRRLGERDKVKGRARQEADRLVSEGKLHEALGQLDRICHDHPDDLELAAHRRNIEALAEKQRLESQRLDAERRQAAERARKVAACRTAVDAAVAEREWARALQAIDLAESGSPGEPVFAELRRGVEQARRRDGLEELDRAVRQSFARRDLDAAARQLAAGRLDYSQEPPWQTLNDQLSRLRAYDRLLAESEDLIIGARYETAQMRLREAIAINPSDGRADVMLKGIGNENNAIRRLTLQFRLLVRKYRSIVKWAGIAAVLILVAGLATYYLRFRVADWRFQVQTPPPPLTLRPEPSQVAFTYNVGAPGLSSRQTIDFQPTDVRFAASTDADWLSVTPQSGNRLSRLDVIVTKPPGVGDYTAHITVSTSGRPVMNNPVMIPVHLTVLGPEPTPVPLRLDPVTLTFTYVQKAAIPQPKVIQVKEGNVGSATANRDWLLLTRTTNNILVSLKGLEGLGATEHSGTVTVESADRRHLASVSVRLIVTAPKAVSSSQLGPAPEIPLPPPPPPIGKGCDQRVYGGIKYGTTNWSGHLKPGDHLDLTDDTLGLEGDPPPAGLRLEISRVTPGILVTQKPGPDNACGPIRLVNDSKTQVVEKIRFRWDLKQ